jgi:hypothetical protein
VVRFHVVQTSLLYLLKLCTDLHFLD